MKKLFALLVTLSATSWGQGTSQVLLSPAAFTNYFFSLHNPVQFYRSNNLVYFIPPSDTTNYVLTTNLLVANTNQFVYDGTNLTIKSGALTTNISLNGATLLGSFTVGSTASLIFTNGSYAQDSTGARIYDWKGIPGSNTIATFKDITNVLAGMSVLTNNYYIFNPSQFTTVGGTNIIIRPDAWFTNLNAASLATTNNFYSYGTNYLYGPILVTTNTSLTAGTKVYVFSQTPSSNSVVTFADLTSSTLNFNANQFGVSGTNVAIKSGVALTNAGLSGVSAITGTLLTLSADTIIDNNTDFTVGDTTSFINGADSWNFKSTPDSNTIARISDLDSAGANSLNFNVNQFVKSGTNISFSVGAVSTNMQLKGATLTGGATVQDSLVLGYYPLTIYWYTNHSIVEPGTGKQYDFRSGVTENGNTVARLTDVSNIIVTAATTTNLINAYNTNQFILTNGHLSLKTTAKITNFNEYGTAPFYGLIQTNYYISIAPDYNALEGAGPGITMSGGLTYINLGTNGYLRNASDRYYVDSTTNGIVRFQDLTNQYAVLTNMILTVSNELPSTYTFDGAQFDATGGNVRIISSATITNLGVVDGFNVFASADPFNQISIIPANEVVDYLSLSSYTNIGIVSRLTEEYKFDGASNNTSVVRFQDISGLGGSGGPTNWNFNTNQFTVASATNITIKESALVTNLVAMQSSGLKPSINLGILNDRYPGIYTRVTNAPVFVLKNANTADTYGSGGSSYIGINGVSQSLTLGLGDVHASTTNSITNLTYSLHIVGTSAAADGHHQYGDTYNTATKVGVNNSTPQQTLHIRGAQGAAHNNGVAVEFANSPRTNDGPNLRLGSFGSSSTMHDQFRVYAISGPNNNSNSSEVVFQYRTNLALADFLKVSTTNINLRHKVTFAGAAASSVVMTDGDGNLVTGAGSGGTTYSFNANQLGTNGANVWITNGALVTNIVNHELLTTKSNSIVYRIGNWENEGFNITTNGTHLLTVGQNILIGLDASRTAPGGGTGSLNSVGIGNSVAVSAENAVVIGYDASTIDNANGAIVVGQGAQAIYASVSAGDQGQIAIGSGSSVTASEAAVFGANASSDYANTVAIGSGSEASRVNQIRLGNYTQDEEVSIPVKTVFDPSEVWIDPGSIDPECTTIRVQTTGALSTASLTAGLDGQILYIICSPTSAGTVRFPNSTSGLLVPGGGNRDLTAGDVLHVIYDADTAKWRQVSFTDY